MSDNDEKVAKLVQKALKDPKLKAALLKNPNAVVEAEMRVKLPAGLKVKVIEDTASAVHFVLPVDYRLKGNSPGATHVSKPAAEDEQRKRQELIERAWSDPAFKAELLKNPKATLSKETGATFPTGASVTILQDTEKVVHLILPQPSARTP
jgi:formate-dependent phosphoribosylglycinamide formyltransferase (GAR transformylase)